MRPARLLPLLVPIALVAASCGQKAGVAGSESAEDVPVAPAPETAAPAGTDAPGVTERAGRRHQRASATPRRPPPGRSCPVTATPTA